VVGMEEGIFPGMRTIGEPEEMEEERRLCYVALTRAKERLYLTCASQRMLFGRTSSNRPSRFTGEIPPDLLEQSGRRYTDRRPSYGWDEDDFDQTIPSVSTYRSPYSRGESFDRGYERKPAAPSYPSRPISQRPGVGYTAPAKPAASLPSFQKGDSVEHKAFGRGMVLNLQKMGGDALIEIAFDNVGTKKLMLKSASQYMKKV